MAEMSMQQQQWSAASQEFTVEVVPQTDSVVLLIRASARTTRCHLYFDGGRLHRTGTILRRAYSVTTDGAVVTIEQLETSFGAFHLPAFLAPSERLELTSPDDSGELSYELMTRMPFRAQRIRRGTLRYGSHRML